MSECHHHRLTKRCYICDPVINKTEEHQEMDAEDFDADGYPTDYALNKIKTWSCDDVKGLFDYIEYLWKWPSGVEKFSTTNKIIVKLITGGWSGNEDIIGAL